MYARITTYRNKPEKLDESLALAEAMKPEIMSIPGIKFYFSTGNEDGNCAVIAIYESQQAAEAARDVARELFARASEFLESEPQPRGYQVLLQGVNA